MQPVDIVKSEFCFHDVFPRPYWIRLEDDVENQLNKYYGNNNWKKHITQYMYSDYQMNGSVSEISVGNNCVKNIFGYIEQKGSISHIIDYPIKQPDMTGYRWPDPEQMADWDKLAETYKRAEGSFRLVGRPYGLFERAWSMRGMENLLVDMITDPDFVQELMNGYLGFLKNLYKIVKERIPCEGILGGDDVSDQRGPIMGEKRWRELVKPIFKNEIEFCHSIDLPYFSHMCGNIEPIIDDLVELRPTGIESLQPEAMNVMHIKEVCRNKVCLIGAVGVQNIIPFGTPEEVRKTLAELQQKMYEDGGYVLSTAKPLFGDIPVENVVALIEECIGRSL